MINRGGILLFILSFIYAGFFCVKNISATEFETGGVVFNEIAWMGTEVSFYDEWIELKNLTNTDIDLTGWSIIAEDGSPEIELVGIISANGYLLLERSDDNTVLTIEADLIYTGALGDDGEFLGLRDNEQNLIDFVDDLDGWSAGDKNLKQTMERVGDDWQTSIDVGGTPRAENSSLGSITEEPASAPDSEEEQTELVEETTGEEEYDTESGDSCGFGDVLINEFVSDPADGEVEWIELHNVSGKNIDLNNWTIEEGSGAKTVLKSAIANHTFVVIEKPSGNLNNKGDVIILKDFEGVLIDQVAYGDWDDGQIENNAPLASDPWSVARKMDGYNSFNNKNDFLITTTPTKGKSNIITSEEESEALSADYDYNQEIAISEIFPNPIGDDSEGEFIELYNKSNREVDLVGWRLGDESLRKFEFGQGFVLLPNGYLVVYRSKSNIALNNSGDKIKLYQPFKDEPLQIISYGRAEEGQSYVLINNGYEWSNTVTPGIANQPDIPETLLIVEFDCPDIMEVGKPFVFDGTDSLAEGNEQIVYNWDFGDGIKLNLPSPEHTFLNDGVYVVKLKINDGEKETTKEKTINVVKSLAINYDSIALPIASSSIIINEILPNPAGDDIDGEWIELYNPNNFEINLSGWQIDDSEDGSRPYKFSSSSIISARSYFLLTRAESGLALNNEDDGVRLLDEAGDPIDSVEYENTFENQSYARGENDKWFWTAMLTPVSKNIIDLEIGDELIMNLSLADGSATGVYQEMTIEETKQEEPGQLVKIKGVVIVEPNILASQYFYIAEKSLAKENTNYGIQIYNYKKDFPILKVGDYIEVVGEISEINNEKRIKTKTIGDFLILSSEQSIESAEITCGDIGEIYVGDLVKVSGTITERKSSTIFIDDGTDEAQIYIKSLTGISPKIFAEGAEYLVIGIVSQTASGIKIMPRYSDDVIKKDVESNNETGKVLGETAVSNEWEIAARDEKMELFKYLLVIAGGIILVLGGLLIKTIIAKT